VDVAATLARINLSEQNIERAIEVLQRTLKIQPSSALLFNLLGNAFAETGQLSAAKQAYQAVLRIGTRSIELQIDTIRSLLELRSFDVAEAALEALDNIHGESVEGLTMRGLLELKRDNPQAAIEPLKKVLTGHPDIREAVLLIARAESRSGDMAGSAKRLEQWLVKQPQDSQARYQLANVYLVLNESPDKAIETYKRVIEDEPNHGLALNNLAWMLRDSNPSAALDYARRAAAAQPRSALILDTLGSLQAQLGDTQFALKTLQSAVNAAPLNNEIKLRLSRVQLQSGDSSAARENLREIVASGEDSESVQKARDLLVKIER
jgi:tetratricopeptide (TPR) repeat protein